MGEGGESCGRGVSANELSTAAQINFGDLTPYLTYASVTLAIQDGNPRRVTLHN